MMAKGETKFQSKVVTALRGQGAMIFNCHGHLMQASGWPDLWIGHPLWTGWLELKVEKRGYQDNQKDKIRELMRRGVNAFGLRLCPATKEWIVEDIVSGVSWSVDPARLIQEFAEISSQINVVVKGQFGNDDVF